MHSTGPRIRLFHYQESYEVSFSYKNYYVLIIMASWLLPNSHYSYYEYIWQRNKGVSFSSLFQGIPKSLQADISLSLYKNILDQVRNLWILVSLHPQIYCS